MERKSDVLATTHNRIYDEFEPISNLKSEQGFETLTVYLPGFKKEQLKVQVTTTRKLRVIGERPAGGSNKWIRFRNEFPIASNVDVDSISAKFEGANLVLKLPKHEPTAKQTSHIVTTAKQPPVPKENLKVPSPVAKEAEKVQAIEKEAEQAVKEEASKDEEKRSVCDGVKKDYRSSVNAYKENLGGYMALMKNNRTAITAGMVVPAAAVLLLSLGFFAGKMYTTY